MWTDFNNSFTVVFVDEQTALDSFDEFLHKAQLPYLSDSEWIQASLPVRDGGL